MYQADRSLVARMMVGDQNAFDEFFERFAPRIAAFLARRARLDIDERDDLVQATLIKAIDKLHQYRGEAGLATWLTTIARRELFDRRRAAARRPQHASLADPVVEAAVEQMEQLRPPEPDDDAASTQQRATVKRVLACLPAHYAQVLEAKYGDELSVEDLARDLGTSVAAVQSLLARARDAFRHLWSTTATRRDPDRQPP